MLAVLAAVLFTLMNVSAEGTAAVTPPEPNPDRAFVARTMGATVVHHRELLVLGGWNGQRKLYNDVWKLTDDGWAPVTDRARWSPRSYFQSVSFKGRLWVLGGFVFRPPRNVLGDVWTSRDGVGWRKVDRRARWEAREHYGLVVHDGRLMMVGGVSYGPRFHAMKDVWASRDGRSWERLTADAPWGPRRGFGAVSYRGRIWVFGGFDSRDNLYSDLWSSPDGVKWTREPAYAGWRPRGTFRSCVFRDRIWMVGGNVYGEGTIASDEVWAYDGAWHLATDRPGWEPRAGAELFCDAERMVLVGGFDGEGPGRRVYEDVWESYDGVTWREVRRDNTDGRFGERLPAVPDLLGPYGPY